MRNGRTTATIPVVISGGAMALLLALTFPGCKQGPASYPEPQWVIDIRGRIDASKCGPSNCSACDTDKCSGFPDSCKVVTSRYSCGPSCDAVIALCTDSGPAETNEKTLCQSDDDCWCRSFTGAQFIPGEKVSSRCNVETNRCYPCYYE